MRTLNRAKRVITIMLALALVFALSPHLPGVEGEALAASASTLRLFATYCFLISLRFSLSAASTAATF